MSRYLLVSLLLAFSISVAYAVPQHQNKVSPTHAGNGPADIGYTSLPPGQYVITNQSSGKAYSIMVTTTKRMIAAPMLNAIDKPAATIVTPNSVPSPVRTNPAPLANSVNAPIPAVQPAATPAANTSAMPARPRTSTKGIEGEFSKLIKSKDLKELQKLIK